MPASADFLSSIVTSAMSMSDFAHTLSFDRLPARMAARIVVSLFSCSTSAANASVNFCWSDSFPMRVFYGHCWLLLFRRIGLEHVFDGCLDEFLERRQVNIRKPFDVNAAFTTRMFAELRQHLITAFK